MASDHEQPAKRRKLCSLGTGELVHIVHYIALADKVDEFEKVVQNMVYCLYHLQSGITDIRVSHPRCGEVIFVITFLSRDDLEKFQQGPQLQTERHLEKLVRGGAPSFSSTGCLMPAAHSLASLLKFLRQQVVGTSHVNHDVRRVKGELAKWYPRPCEYSRYVHWNAADPKAYTRNLVFHNDHMDVILMCWPAGSQSKIHDHDASSCWVTVVEGTVTEVQYAVPCLDRKFIETEMKNPTGAVGRCGPLRVQGEFKLEHGTITTSYANNEIGLHRVENRSDKPAYTLHVYAPALTKMKIFKESGEVHVHSTTSERYESIDGERNDGSLDVEAWNDHRWTEFLPKAVGGCSAPK